MSTEYILAFPDIHELPDKVQLYIVSRESSFSGYVSSPYLGAFRNFTTTSGTVTINLPIGIELPIGRSKNKVLYIKASKPVAVFGLTHNKLKVGEGFAVYPIHVLGKYYTASTVPPKGGYNAFIAVIGTANQNKCANNTKYNKFSKGQWSVLCWRWHSSGPPWQNGSNADWILRRILWKHNHEQQACGCHDGQHMLLGTDRPLYANGGVPTAHYSMWF